MARLLCCVVALAACARPRPIATTASIPDPADPADPAEVPVNPTDPAAPAAKLRAIENPATPASTADAPPTVEIENSTGPHCLYVAPNDRVVRCYWTRGDCEVQVAYNKEAGLTGAQRCKAVAEPVCLNADTKDERCYPTAADCEAMVANMKKRNRPTSACVPKRGP